MPRALLVLSLLLACADETAPTGTPFWQLPQDNTGDVVDTRDPGAEDTGDAPDAPVPRTLSYQVVIQTEEWDAGTFTWTFTDDTGEPCALEAPLSAIAQIEACDDCTAAGSMVIEESEVLDGADGPCSDALEVSAGLLGRAYVFGHGATYIGDYQGLELYELWAVDDDGWHALDGAYSYMGLAPDSDLEVWAFGQEGLTLD